MTALYVTLAAVFLVLFVLYFVFLDHGTRGGQDICIVCMFVLACGALVLISR